MNMKNMNYVAPVYNLAAFNCPNCGVLSKHDWKTIEDQEEYWCITKSKCHNCEKLNVWISIDNTRYSGYFDGKKYSMIYPKKNSIPLPNEDLEEDIKNDYLEAANILKESPRWAWALLRYALQNLMIQLWQSWKNINDDIKELVKNWLNPTIQKALDSVRIVWNEAVHPWELDLKDDVETVTKIFWLINIIAEALISIPKQIEVDYWSLPADKIKWVENRDK